MDAGSQAHDPGALPGARSTSGEARRLASLIQPGSRGSWPSHRRVAAFGTTRCDASAQPSPNSSVRMVRSACRQRSL